MANNYSGLEINKYEYGLIIILSIIIIVISINLDNKYLNYLGKLGIIINNVYLSYIFLRHLPKFFEDTNITDNIAKASEKIIN